MTLYSYCLPYDDGAAPNPYWGVCTLAICKPAIRRTAQIGNWIVGLGAKNSQIGDVSGHVVYAMRVSSVLTLREYDEYCRTALPEKIPSWNDRDFRRRVGDCIYDFSPGTQPSLRASVHTEKNRRTDLGGEKVLLSDHFFYFGDNPIRLPAFLEPIIHQTQGHKSRANEPYLATFVSWVQSLSLPANVLLGEPQLKNWILSLGADQCQTICSTRDEEDDSQDIELS